VVGVEEWAEVRRLHFVRGLSIREIHRRTGLHRDTIRRALGGDEPPVYRRAPMGSTLDSFKDEIHRLLRADPKLPGQRVRELIEPLGFRGGGPGRGVDWHGPAIRLRTASWIAGDGVAPPGRRLSRAARVPTCSQLGESSAGQRDLSQPDIRLLEPKSLHILDP
jgi:hypothetical protein